jgi:hypothetical protein
MYDRSPWNRSEILSLCTLAVAVIAPFVTFHFLDPKIQELKHIAKLKGTEYEQQRGDERVVGLDLKNEGKLPANNIKVVFKPLLETAKIPDRKDIAVFPPSPFSVAGTENSLVVTVDRPLGPGQSISVVLYGMNVPWTVAKRCAVSFGYYNQGEVEGIQRLSAPPTPRN